MKHLLPTPTLRIVFILCILSGFPRPMLHAQDACRMPAVPESFALQLMESSDAALSYPLHGARGGVRNIALNIVIMVYSDGPLVTPQFVQHRVDQLNTIFAPIQAHFEICSIQYVDYPEQYSFYPPTFHDWNPQIESYVTQQAWLPGYLNIFYADGDGPNASIPMPGNSDRVLMNTGSEKLFAHEVGHYFSLIHTHEYNGWSFSITTQELVNGSNCASSGDFICDTPADPGLTGRMAPYPQCAYIDTVSADANGDLYQPDVNNYMSAAYPNCITQFTPQQYSRMSYTLDHERAYLKQGGQTLQMDSLPRRRMCLSDEPVTLQALTPGGEFSGPGVSNGMFHPDLAGIGSHVITYSQEGSGLLATTSDAFQSYHDSTWVQNSLWQSFVCGISGSMERISIVAPHTNPLNLHYRIFSGSGISGTLLQEGDVVLQNAAGLDWQHVVLSSALPVQSGAVLTLQLESDNPFEMAGIRANTYLQGSSSITGDWAFISYILPDAPLCGNGTSTIVTVGDTSAIAAGQIFPAYCPDAPASALSFSPTGGEIRINGSLTSLLDPATLGTGVHSVEYRYTNTFGCQSIASFPVNIGPVSEMSLADGSTFCLSDSLLTVNATPEDGQWMFDGVVWNSFPIDLASLSPGLHTLDYVKSHAYPWIDQVDASYTPQDGTIPPYWGITPNSTLWQSFKPNTRGYIDYFELGLYTNIVTPVSYELRRGTGLSGDVLYSGSRSFGGESTYMQEFDFPDFNLLLDPDSTYTFTVSFTNPNGTFSLAGYLNDYADGTSNYTTPNTEVDIKFALHTNPLYLCSSDTAHATFEVVNQFVVDLGPDQILNGASSVVLDAGNAGNSYLWSTGETTQQIEIQAANAGEIWVQVYNDAGCSASDTVQVQLVTRNGGISDAKLRLYPNPTKELVQLSGDEMLRALSIYDLSGRKVLDCNFNGPAAMPVSIPTAQLPQGMYFVKLEAASGMYWMEFVKQ